MGRILAALTSLLILLIAAAFIAPGFIDWTVYRPAIEEAASAVLGRTVKTSGAITLTLLPEPRLRVDRIFVGEGTAGALKAEAADISLALPSLLGGTVEATFIKLVRPEFEVDLTSPTTPVQATAPKALPVSASVRSVDIDNGRVTLLRRAGATVERIRVEQVKGVITGQTGNAYRFAGRFSMDGETYDLKSSVTPALRKARVTATLLDLRSKAALQADGWLYTDGAPIFEGSMALQASSAVFSSPAPVDFQAKGTARLELEGAALAGLVVTIDPLNRGQILTGSAQADFASGSASLSLDAQSLDADALLLDHSANGSGDAGNSADVKDPSAWAALQSAFGRMPWLAPKSDLRVELGARQMQLRGELLTDVAVVAERGKGRWTVQKGSATLPGDATASAVGTISQRPEGSNIFGLLTIEGKNLGRFARWAAPAMASGKSIPAKPFSLKTSLALSSEATAFEGVSGDVAGTPFTGSFRLERGPTAKIIAVLNGDAFDFSGVNLSLPVDATSSSLADKLLQQTGLNDFLAGSIGVPIAETDLTLSAKSIKTASFDALNVTARINTSPSVISISKLNLETADGLAIRGDGSVPLKQAGRGEFKGHVEARSEEAFRQALALTSTGERFGNRQLASFVPAAADISIAANGADINGVLDGEIGQTRLQAKGQLKGALADGKPSTLSLNAEMTSADGKQLASQLYPGLAEKNGTQSGGVTLRVSGPLLKLATSATLRLPDLQGQFDGVTEYADGAISAVGKMSGQSDSPETLLPAAFLALAGGEARAALRIDATVSATANEIVLEKIRTEAPRNAVTGRVAIADWRTKPRIDGELKAEQLFLAPVLSFFVSQSSAATEDAWSGQPFDVNAFSARSARLSVAAKSLRMSESLILSQGQIAAQLENGRLEVTRLDGRLVGGNVTASGMLEPKAGGVAATARISLTSADLSSVFAGGKQSAIVGRGALLAEVSGQALSPKALIAVLRGRGLIGLSDGQLLKISPAQLAKAADELQTATSAVPEDVAGKRLADAMQSADFRFRRQTFAFSIADGILQFKRAWLRALRDGSVRIEALVDLSKMQADAAMHLSPPPGKQARWPDATVSLAGPVSEIGAAARLVDTGDIVRLAAAKRMEADLKRLESYNNRPQPPAPLPWTATTEETSPRGPRGKPDPADVPPPRRDPRSPTQRGEDGGADVVPAPPKQRQPFDARLRELLQSQSGDTVRAQSIPPR